MGSEVVPFCGLSLGSYKVTPKMNYSGAQLVQCIFEQRSVNASDGGVDADPGLG